VLENKEQTLFPLISFIPKSKGFLILQIRASTLLRFEKKEPKNKDALKFAPARSSG